MSDRKYQTIDPLILETLNINEKRIHHIFDILHGRDTRPETERHSKSHTIATSPSQRLPVIPLRQKYESSKMEERTYKKQKSIISHRGQLQKSLVSITQKEQVPIKKIFPLRSARSNPKVETKAQRKKIEQLSIKQEKEQKQEKNFLANINSVEKKQQLQRDYGTISIKKSRSLELNPKDVYRLQIQQLVSKPTQIQEMEDMEKLMKRLKRRYQHLRKFDQHYYSKLNKSQIALL